jgi:hypothetical protein
MPGRVICSAIVVCLALLAGAARAQDVTVEGNRFLRDGKPWVAEGVTLVGLVAPEGRLGKNRPNFELARAEFGAGTMGEVRRFGADLVRFPVSQAGLDPRSPIYDPDYRDEVLDGVALARAAGLNVIVVMQWQGPSGKRAEVGLPSGTTRRAWRAIAPALAEDRGVLLEVFNEPELRGTGPDEWATWQKSMQSLIDLLRDEGSKNVLLVGGVMFSHSFKGAPPLSDPLDQLGYAVHPFLTQGNQTRKQWEGKFGDYAATHPLMATSFSAHAGGGYCRPELKQQTVEMLAYLREKRIGLVAWALDLPSLREEDGSYTTFDDLVCGQHRDGGRGGAGQLIHEYFLAN